MKGFDEHDHVTIIVLPDIIAFAGWATVIAGIIFLIYINLT